MTLVLLGALFGGVAGYVAGWWRRGHTRPDLADWKRGWECGYTTGLSMWGGNPLKKRVRFATLDELAPKVLHDGESE